jgi:hypothetical protein
MVTGFRRDCGALGPVCPVLFFANQISVYRGATPRIRPVSADHPVRASISDVRTDR